MFHQSAVESACLHQSVRWLSVPTTCGSAHQAGVSARYSGVQTAIIMPFVVGGVREVARQHVQHGLAPQVGIK